jgi:hypothetical protein
LENLAFEVVLVGAKPVEEAQALGCRRGGNERLRGEHAGAGRERENADAGADDRDVGLYWLSDLNLPTLKSVSIQLPVSAKTTAKPPHPALSVSCANAQEPPNRLVRLQKVAPPPLKF